MPVEINMKRLLVIFTLLTIASLTFVACSSDDPDPTATSVPETSGVSQASAPTTTSVSQPKMLAPGDDPQPPVGALDTSKTYTATFKTDAGEFDVLLFDDEAPLTVENFINLATIGFYDGTTFHRVLANFMAQGGDPTGTGSGGPGYRFRDEFDPTRRHDKPGILSMANSGSNTNGSQFFITFVPTPPLDGYDASGVLKPCSTSGVSCHAVFGEVISGMDVVLNISLRDPGTAQTLGDTLETIIISES